jgi:hypothetical protein
MEVFWGYQQHRRERFQNAQWHTRPENWNVTLQIRAYKVVAPPYAYGGVPREITAGKPTPSPKKMSADAESIKEQKAGECLAERVPRHRTMGWL